MPNLKGKRARLPQATVTKPTLDAGAGFAINRYPAVALDAKVLYIEDEGVDFRRH